MLSQCSRRAIVMVSSLVAVVASSPMARGETSAAFRSSPTRWTRPISTEKYRLVPDGGPAGGPGFGVWVCADPAPNSVPLVSRWPRAVSAVDARKGGLAYASPHVWLRYRL